MEERTILHVDMDSFYASVEVLLDPSLQAKPVIVGGSGDRGVVASCNYEARSYGVHSAMPSVRARRLCPHAVFVHGRFDTYSDYSKRFHEIFRSFTPLVEGISLDEAFLDVTGALRLFGDGATIGRAIRAQIREELGLRCAVGVGRSKFIAKLASKAAKPRPGRPGQGPTPGVGVLVVPADEELEFIHPLPVGALWGVGPATQKKLDRFGIVTVADLAALPVDTLVSALGTAQGRHLHELAWARDDRPVVVEQAPKSIGHEETYAVDLHDHEALGREAVRMADAVAHRARRAGLEGRTVTIKVRFHDFNTITRSHTLPTPTATAATLASVAKDLLAGVDPSMGVRLFGISLSNLAVASDEQLTLDGAIADHTGWDDASRAVDAIRARFGDAAVGPAALAEADGTGLRLKREGDTQWGPRGRGRTDR
ncbi:MAG TPA: DNA polymerase IV [Acidimicrobiales bacterium]|nr:DNA polymerase IV [Acidimicrobiales bacterium]